MPDTDSPPGAATCPNREKVKHEMDIRYTTTVPLRCTFGKPSSGSFARVAEEDWFYRGMVLELPGGRAARSSA